MTVSKTHLTGFLGALMLMACESEFELKNGLPRITWVASVQAEEGEHAEFTLWVQDPEGDPVDLRAAWVAGAANGPFVLAQGSAPHLGLPTQLGLNTANGQSHTLFWDLSEVPAGEVELTLWLNDRPREDDSEEVGFKVTLDPRETSAPVLVTPL